MYSEEESSKQLTKPVVGKNGKIVRKNGKVVTKTVRVPDFDKNDSFTLKLEEKGKVSQVNILVRKSKPARQIINMSEEAYQNMVSQFPPEGHTARAWNSLNKNQKLKWHCEQIAEQLGGKLESFKVFD